MSIISIDNLYKEFKSSGEKIRAVDKISFEVPEASTFGFLGPNGAGKTTTLRMLVTLIKPSGGHACIAGFDLMKAPQSIRQHIGYVGQSGGCDANATGKENLILQARLYGMSYRVAKARSQELIELFHLQDICDRKTSTYSGGQRRRVEIAMGMVNYPKVLFLDEPTSGLDPQSREFLWAELRKLQQLGVTLFLTTHYLDEADSLCERLVIIDHGQVVSEGSPAELKRQIAGDVLTISIDRRESLETAKSVLERQSFIREIVRHDDRLRLYVNIGEEALPLVLQLMAQANLRIHTLDFDRPTLNEVFLHKTGRSLRDIVLS